MQKKALSHPLKNPWNIVISEMDTCKRKKYVFMICLSSAKKRRQGNNGGTREYHQQQDKKENHYHFGKAKESILSVYGLRHFSYLKNKIKKYTQINSCWSSHEVEKMAEGVRAQNRKSTNWQKSTIPTVCVSTSVRFCQSCL